MKWFLYNALFAVAYAAMLPAFLLRMKRRGGYRERMGDRFARYPGDVVRALRGMDAAGGPVWIHAVSVGEVQVAGMLMREMRKTAPDVMFVLSTTSSTGWKTAQKEISARDILIYNPLDFPRIVKKALDAVRPRAVILTESELWPNFIRISRKRNIPLFLVNARVSDRSAPRYKALRWFFGDVLHSFTKIYAQSALDADRLAAAGAARGSIEVQGSFKYDASGRNPAKEAELREWTGGGRIMLGGSTWPGEDEVLLSFYGELPPDVKLVIAPRHFEKADAVEANILKAGFACVRRSRGDRAGGGGRREVLLADTTGELTGFYGIATVAFVGKSLCEHGAQNMIEPCMCGVPAIVGPNTENFRPVMADLLQENAILQVRDAAELRKAVISFFCGGARDAAALGERAMAAVGRRRGVVARCAREISASAGLLPGEGKEKA